MCPQKPREGASCQPLQPRHEWGPERWRTLSPRGWGKWGGQGGFAPWRGVVGAVPPQNLKKGRVANSCHPAHGWGPKRWQTIGQRGWANGGSRGHSPLAGGLGDVPPKTKRGGELPTPATPPRVGPRALANPKPTRVGKMGGPGGLRPPGGGLWGVSPHKTLKRGE
jgi:hypothetical protein